MVRAASEVARSTSVGAGPEDIMRKDRRTQYLDAYEDGEAVLSSQAKVARAEADERKLLAMTR
jgi:hypothetical protein